MYIFWGSKSLPADERPPIPYVPELDDPSWRPVYGQSLCLVGSLSGAKQMIDLLSMLTLNFATGRPVYGGQLRMQASAVQDAGNQPVWTLPVVVGPLSAVPLSSSTV